MSRFAEVVERLRAVIESRKGGDPDTSWSAKLLADPTLASKKIAEEAMEAALAAVKGEKDALAARIDLHGLTHDAARAALTRFIERSVAEGWRAVLVITGKGVGGDGVLRRRAPEWLAAPPIRPHVAGVSEAHRRHGGDGALYVALKRRR